MRNSEKLGNTGIGVPASARIGGDPMGTLPSSDQNTKSPAFSFYAKDWLAATLTWALDARGAYVTLLAYQWDAGSIPGDDAAALGRILGVTTLKARAVWKLIHHKFDRTDDGAWTNARLEQERQKQSDRRAALRENGSKGGRPKNQQVNQTETNRLSETKPNGNQQPNLDKSLSSSSSIASSKKQEQQAAAPLIKSPAYYEKRRNHCAFVGSKLEVPIGLHAELRTSLGGPDPEKALQDWYLELNETAEIESWRMPVDGEIFKWLKAHYAQKFPAPVALNGAKSVDAQIDAWGHDD